MAAKTQPKQTAPAPQAAAKKKEMKATQVITPVAFISYPHLDTPVSPPAEPGQPPKKPQYSAAFVWPAGTDLMAVQNAIIAAAAERWGESAIAKLRSNALKNPLRSDAKSKDYPEGALFLNARSFQRPGMVHRYAAEPGGPPVDVADDQIKDVFYPGAKVRARLTFYAFDKGVNKGVGVGLDHVQSIEYNTPATPRWDGRGSAQDAFEAEGVLTPADLSDLEDNE